MMVSTKELLFAFELVVPFVLQWEFAVRLVRFLQLVGYPISLAFQFDSVPFSLHHCLPQLQLPRLLRLLKQQLK
jgi:hypothetical protein